MAARGVTVLEPGVRYRAQLRVAPFLAAAVTWDAFRAQLRAAGFANITGGVKGAGLEVCATWKGRRERLDPPIGVEVVSIERVEACPTT